MFAGDNEYKGGHYIGKLELSEGYPLSKTSFYMLTPSGRFIINKSICLTNSVYYGVSHANPSWNIQTMIIGLISIMLDNNEVGENFLMLQKDKKNPTVYSNRYTSSIEERNKLAKESQTFNITNYRDLCLQFDQFVNPDGTFKTSDETDEFLKIYKESQKNKKSKIN